MLWLRLGLIKLSRLALISDPPASAFRVLRLQVCATMPDFISFLIQKENSFELLICLTYFFLLLE